MNNLGKQLISFVIGIIFNFLLIKFFWWGYLIPELFNDTSPDGLFVAKLTIGVASLAYFGWGGLREIKPVHSGVVLVLGAIASWFTLPAGRFWTLPEPFMGLIEVSLKEKTLDIPIKKALSKDNIGADIDTQVQYWVENPIEFVRIEEPKKALSALMDRNIRWGTNFFGIEKLPSLKNPFSKMLEGDITFISDALEGDKTIEPHDIPDIVSDVIKSWGLGIKRVLVTDIQIPEEIIKANTKKITEEAEQIYETTQTDTLIVNMEKIKDKFPNLSDSEISVLVQAERGKRDVFTIDGSASDLVKAGFLAGRKS